MASANSENVQSNDVDTKDEREMKMMRFIFSLPVGDISLVPAQERFCILCMEPYQREWTINGKETAIVLPCGHFVGLLCIRKWLSPFEDGHSRCPVQGCATEFPCRVNAMFCHQQTIVRGKLRPKVDVRLSINVTLADSGTGSKEDDEWEDSVVDSVTEEMVGESMDDVQRGNVEDEDLGHRNAFEIPLKDPNDAYDDLSIIGADELFEAEIAEAEVSEIRSLGKWSMVRGAVSKLTRRRGKGHAY